MSEDPASRTPRTARVLLALVALGVLLVVPTWTDEAPRAADPSDDRGTEGIEDRESALRLERRAIELEAELRRLRAEQAELEHALVKRQVEEKIEAMRLEAEQLDGADQADRARALRDQMERLARESELYSHKLDGERERLTERERSLRLAEIEELRSREEAERAADLEADVRRMKARLERERRAGGEPRREQDRLETELAALREMAIYLEREGRTDELDELEDRIEQLRREIAGRLGSRTD